MRLTSHPLHPALAHFPVALWLSAAAADALALASGDETWPPLARAALAAGLIMAVPTLLAGALELWLRRIPRTAVATVAFHIGCMLTAFMCFLASYALRQGGPATAAALAWSAAGVVAVVLGGWLGGTLVYGFGIGGRDSARESSP